MRHSARRQFHDIFNYDVPFVEQGAKIRNALKTAIKSDLGLSFGYAAQLTYRFLKSNNFPFLGR